MRPFVDHRPGGAEEQPSRRRARGQGGALTTSVAEHVPLGSDSAPRSVFSTHAPIRRSAISAVKSVTTCSLIHLILASYELVEHRSSALVLFENPAPSVATPMKPPKTPPGTWQETSRRT